MKTGTLALLAIGGAAAYLLWKKSGGKLAGLADDYSDYEYRVWYYNTYLPWYWNQMCARQGMRFDGQRCVNPYAAVASQVVSQNVDPYGYQNCLNLGGRTTQIQAGGPLLCVPYGWDGTQGQQRSDCYSRGGVWNVASGALEGQCSIAAAAQPQGTSLRWTWDVSQGRYVPSCPYNYHVDSYYNPSSCVLY